MNQVKLNHIALQSTSIEKSDLFFSKILGIPKIREFKLSKELSEKIFDLPTEVTVCVYDNEKCKFEVFITKKKQNFSFNHVCIEINNREELIKKCKLNNLEVRLVEKKDKTLLFIKDFFGNIYEIKS